MVVLPICVTLFFTTLMADGQPEDMPVGVVDLDNTTTTRKLTRLFDSFQNSKVVAHYPSMSEARHAMQRNEIYGFLLFPKNMTQDLISSRQPKMSFYYSNTSLTAGALLYKEMKTLCTLGSAAVGKATLSAKGATEEQAMTFLQPVALDSHMIGNPWVNYNMYLCNMLVPGAYMIFIFLITAYAIGTERKFGTLDDWIRSAGGNPQSITYWAQLKAITGKLLPHTVIFLLVMYLIMAYMYGYLGFPAPGGMKRLALLGFLAVTASQGFATFISLLIPDIRMSMSICSLWAVLSFSMVGSAFPVFAMDAPLQSAAWLFPLRHYYMVYQLCVFNTYPLADAWMHLAALALFTLSPLPLLTTLHSPRR